MCRIWSASWHCLSRPPFRKTAAPNSRQYWSGLGRKRGAIIQTIASSYEAAAKLNGEIRIYLETASQIDVHRVKAQLQYWYGFERPHRTPSDPWGCAFADPRVIQSPAEFANERKRVVEIIRTGLATSWEADVVYHPPGHASAMYHWSSIEGAMHP